MPAKSVDYKDLNKLYYEMMGWDPVTGIPARESLQSLGLGVLYDDIY